MDSTKQIALFGGSFDPVQNAHIKIVKLLSKKFDEVVVLPCGVSPFKQDITLESAVHRINMLKLAFQSLPNVTVSSFETDNEQVSYSYITLEHFKKLDSEAEYTFVIGSDMLKKLHRWAEFNKLKAGASFYVFAREGYPIDEKAIARLQKRKVRISVAKEKMGLISSSFARVAVAFSKKDFSDKSVVSYIKENRLYNDYDEIVRSYKTFCLDAERIEHTYNAVSEGIILSKRFGVSTEKAIIALLIHDIAKNADEELLAQYGIKIDKKTSLLPSKIRHAFVGAQVAKSFFHITDSQILNAIRYHTTGKKGMGKLAKIVYLADSIEKSREYEGLNVVRELATTSLDEAMQAMLEITIHNLLLKKSEVHPLTSEALNYFLEKKHNKERKKLDKEDAERKSQQPLVHPQAHKPANIAVAEPYDLAYTIAQLISDKKGRDIVLIDLRGKTIIADYFVIASVTSTTAVRAITDYVDEKLSRDYAIEPLRRDIDKNWAAVDYSSVIVHIFLEETRKFYNIERLWSDGTNINSL